MRSYFFGASASTRGQTERLEAVHGDSFRAVDLDVRDEPGIERLFAEYGTDIELVIHAAASPRMTGRRGSRAPLHDQRERTLNLLSRRDYMPRARRHPRVHEKVRDGPNALPFVELISVSICQRHEYYGGIDTSMSIDCSLHSLFGASKVAADVLVQEYGRYFGLDLCFAAAVLQARGTPARGCTGSCPISCAARSSATAAAVNWPVTVGMDLDYNMPEIARSRHAENMELVDALSWPKHLIDIYLKTIDKPFGEAWSDMDRAGMAAWLEREFQPNLLLLHIAETDGTAHEYGPDSPEVLAAVERADAAVARVLDSVKAAGAKRAPMSRRCPTTASSPSRSNCNPTRRSEKKGCLTSTAGAR